MSERIVNLEVNEKGSWRRVCSFDLDDFEDGSLEHCAEKLLELSSNKRLTARIISQGETAPLLNWKHGDGWREWRHAQ